MTPTPHHRRRGRCQGPRRLSLARRLGNLPEGDRCRPRRHPADRAFARRQDRFRRPSRPGRRRPSSRKPLQCSSGPVRGNAEPGVRALRRGPRRLDPAAHQGGHPPRRPALCDLPRHAGTERRPRRYPRSPRCTRSRDAMTTALRCPPGRTSASPSARTCTSNRAARWRRSFPSTSIRVNSLHRQGVGRLAEGLAVEATAPGRHHRGGPRHRRPGLRHRRPVAPGILGRKRRALRPSLCRLRQGGPGASGGSRRAAGSGGVIRRRGRSRAPRREAPARTAAPQRRRRFRRS